MSLSLPLLIHFQGRPGPGGENGGDGTDGTVVRHFHLRHFVTVDMDLTLC